MAVNQFIALLRGINVGGNNSIKMADLRLSFEDMGFTNVLTYIQSGNIIFKSEINDTPRLTNKIEQVLSKKFNFRSRIVLITHQQLKRVVDEAPPGFGKDADNYRYDVLFMKEPLTADQMMKKVNPRAGIDKVYKGEFVLYFCRLISKASQSHLSKIITLPEYQNITIRNWNTTTKLLALVQK